MSGLVVETKQKRNTGKVRTHRKEGPTFDPGNSVHSVAKGREGPDGVMF